MGRVTYTNKVELAGIVGDYVTWGKSTNGKKYCSFQIITNAAKGYTSEAETNSKEYIRIFVFNGRTKRMVDSMKEAGFRRGLYVRIEGKLQSSKTEYKGQSIIQIAVHVYKLWIINKDLSETEIE